MNPSDNPRLGKVRALLAKAEDPAASFEESQAYFAKAADLMAKYGIERAMLAEVEPESDNPADRVIVEKGAYLLDRVSLLMGMAEALGCKALRWRIWDPSTRKHVQRVKLYGYESVLDRVEMLYTSLTLQAFNGMRQGRPQPGESTTSYRKAWLGGFTRTVIDRLSEAEQAAIQEADQGTGEHRAELVVASREEKILAIFNAAHPKVRAGRVRRVSGSGWNAGAEAGERADLGTARLGAARRAIA